MAEEIVVTANFGGGGGGDSGSSGLTFTNTPMNGADDPQTVNLSTDTPGEMELKVKIEVANNDHKADAQTTAEQTITIIAKILPATFAHAGDGPLYFADSTSSSIEAFRAEVAEAHIVVTDDPTKTHDRDAYADHEKNTIFIDYRAFTNTDGHWGARGETAMMGMMLHEYGHLSSSGYGNLQSEDYWARQERAEFGSNSDAQYNADNEAFADAFALGASNSLGLDASQYLNADSVHPYDFVGGQSIYTDHSIGGRRYGDDYSSSYSSGSGHAEAVHSVPDYETFV